MLPLRIRWYRGMEVIVPLRPLWVKECATKTGCVTKIEFVLWL